MSQVFVSEATRAGIYIFAYDHCPPHVHARHRGEGWIARVGFSYARAAVALISIALLRNVPSQRVSSMTLRPGWRIAGGRGGDQADDLLGEPGATAREGRLELRSGRTRDARQIIDTRYDPEAERLRVIFRDRATAEVSTRL